MNGWYFLLSRGFSSAAYYSLFPYLLVILVDDFNLPVASASVVVAVSLLAARLLGSAAGAICDRFGAAAYILYSNGAAAVLIGGLLLLPAHFSIAAALILLARGAIGAGQGIAYRVAALDKLGKGDSVKSFARLNLAANAGVVFGPAFTIIAPAANKGALWIPLCLHVLAALTSAGWTDNDRGRVARKSGAGIFSISELLQSLRQLGAPFCFSYLGQWIFLQQLILSLSYYCKAQLGSQSYASFFFSFQAAVSLLGLLAFTRLKSKIQESQYLKIFLLGCFAHSFSFVLVPQVPGAMSWVLMALFAVGITISEIISAPVSDAHIAAAGSKSDAARLFGAATIIQALGMTIGSLAAGALLKFTIAIGQLNNYWNGLFLASLILYAVTYFCLSNSPTSGAAVGENAAGGPSAR